MNNKVLTGPANVGIQVLQYNGQAYAPASTASNDTISGQGIGVQVYSDVAVGDFPGTSRSATAISSTPTPRR